MGRGRREIAISHLERLAVLVEALVLERLSRLVALRKPLQLALAQQQLLTSLERCGARTKVREAGPGRSIEGQGRAWRGGVADEGQRRSERRCGVNSGARTKVRETGLGRSVRKRREAHGRGRGGQELAP